MDVAHIGLVHRDLASTRLKASVLFLECINEALARGAILACLQALAFPRLLR